MKPVRCSDWRKGGGSVTPQRPIMRYHGGKWRIAPWIISFFPEHKVYVEPFGGGASVLLRKKRAVTEIYNDLDSELFNLFRVLRDPEQSESLRKALAFTPFSREEFDAAYLPADTELEQARRTLVKAWCGMHSKGFAHKSGFDTRINRDGYCSRVGTYSKLPEMIPLYRERLKGVVLENVDALSLIPRTDSENTLFYVDPPYILNTRSGKNYRHEMTNTGHCLLAEVLHDCKGKVILSGYSSALYDELYADWQREQCDAYTDGSKARTEVIWLNPAASGQLKNDREQIQLSLGE